MINFIHRFALWVALAWEVYVFIPDSTTKYLIQTFGVSAVIFNSLFDLLIITLIIVAIVKDYNRRKEK